MKENTSRIFEREHVLDEPIQMQHLDRDDNVVGTIAAA
jgi:hypothetical protein